MKFYLIYFALFFFCGCAIFSPKIHKERKNINSTIDSIIIGFKEKDTTILKKYTHKKVYDVFMDITDSLKNDDEVQSYIEYFDRDWKIELPETSARISVSTKRRKASRHYHYIGINYLLKVDSKWVIYCHYYRRVLDGFRGTCVE